MVAYDWFTACIWRPCGYGVNLAEAGFDLPLPVNGSAQDFREVLALLYFDNPDGMTSVRYPNGCIKLDFDAKPWLYCVPRGLTLEQARRQRYDYEAV